MHFYMVDKLLALHYFLVLCIYSQNTSLKKTQLTKIGPVSSKVEFENPHVTKENLHFMFGKPQRNLLDSFSRRDDTEMTKADHMTKVFQHFISLYLSCFQLERGEISAKQKYIIFCWHTFFIYRI